MNGIALPSRVVVFGAGALGALLGARLAQQLPVVLIGRSAHVNAIQAHGLRVGGISDLLVTCGENLSAIRSSEALEPRLRRGDIVFLTVKAAQVAEASEQLVKAARDAPPLPLLAFQNGTGFEAALRAIAGQRFEIGHAISHLGATLVEPGVVENWGGEILLEASPQGRAVQALFERCGLVARTCERLEGQRWKKIAFNCALNPMTALLAVRNRETILDVYRPLRQAVLEEVRREVTAIGIAMPSLEELLAEFETRARASNNLNSMYQDIQRGKPTEIRFLNGAIARRARQEGRSTPVNEALTEALERLEGCATDAERQRAREEGLRRLGALACMEAQA